jgi:ribosome biogenesis GTPase
MSAAKNEGLNQIQKYVTKGQTSVFLGSSGVGKSTIINCLLGFDHIRTGEVREADSKGRHTTTYREMLFLSNGGIVIDTPGMREIQLWTADEGIENIFSDIEELVSACRFNDCTHRNEPGCAIREAIEYGNLDIKRFNNYIRLQQETDHLNLRLDDKAFRRAKRERNKQISMWSKERQKLIKKGVIR